MEPTGTLTYTIATCRPLRTLFGVGGYQAWYVDLVDDEPVRGREPLTQYANRLARDGWEMAHLAFSPNNSLVVVFQLFVET